MREKSDIARVRSDTWDPEVAVVDAPEIDALQPAAPSLAALTPPDRGRVSDWDVTGVVALAALVLGLTQLVVAVRGYGLGRSDVLVAAAWGLAGLAVVATLVLTVRDRYGPGQVVGALANVWRRPPGAWTAFALGVIVAIPVLALYTPILFSDSDSARILAATRYLLDGHNAWDYFAQTQEPTLPPLLLAPVVAFGGLSAVMAFSVASLQVMAGVTAYITYRVTSSLSGAAVAAVSLLCLSGVIERAVKVPLYGVMLSLGYLGGWLAYRAITDPERRTRHAVTAGLLLALAPEAHGIGQLFLAVPLLLLVFAPAPRDAVASLVRIYGAALVVLVPRLVVNLWVGGLVAVTSPRADYWITQGYVVDIQTRFWNYDGINESRGEFLRLLPGRFVDLLGDHGWIVLVFATVGAAVATRGRPRVRAFVLLALAFLVAALTVKRIPTFSRYYAPFWPGLGILAGAACAVAVRRGALGRVAAVLGSVLLASWAFLALGQASERWEGRRVAFEEAAYRELAAAVDDGKGVIGARASQLLYSTRTDVQTWGDQFLTEDEYATYLTWPSDREVRAMLEDHDIGWVYVAPDYSQELRYNDIWLVPAHGEPARHVSAIATSPDFCRWMQPGLYTVLYRVGSCDEFPPSPYEPVKSAGGT